MENKQTNQPAEQFKTMIGGQALIEGILMRGPEKQAIVVRSKEGLVEKVEPIKASKDRNPILGWPLIRGVVNFGASMYNGVKALMFSADYFPDDDLVDTEPTKFERWIEKKFGTPAMEQFILILAVVLGIGFSVGLFFLLPMVLCEYLLFWIKSDLIRNLIEGVVRVAIFMSYMILVSRMKEMKRVFAYHGAEHKTIRCYEAKLPLTIENVRTMSRMHPRCGTSFLFVVMIVSILVFSIFTSLFNIKGKLLKVVVKLLLLPVVVAITYEFNRWVGRHDNKLTRALSWPGMMMQKFTTNEPDESMMEVAIRSLELVIPEQEGKDEW